jgi:ABC-type multidrug transport system permease subunit
MAGSYEFSSYYFGRILADVPFQLLIACMSNTIHDGFTIDFNDTNYFPIIFAVIYCTIVYWTTGLFPDVARFFIFIVIIMLATLNAAALGYLVSSFSPNEQVASAIGPPVFIILLLYGRKLFRVSSKL